MSPALQWTLEEPRSWSDAAAGRGLRPRPAREAAVSELRFVAWRLVQLVPVLVGISTGMSRSAELWHDRHRSR